MTCSIATSNYILPQNLPNSEVSMLVDAPRGEATGEKAVDDAYGECAGMMNAM